MSVDSTLIYERRKPFNFNIMAQDIPVKNEPPPFEGMVQKGRRDNQGKLRYDLLEPYALEKLVEVFTFGATKYADHNWLQGLKWSNITASLERHLAAYKMGEDYDKETGKLHAAHIAWNAMALLSHYRYHPDLDDRNHRFYYTKRVGLDIDEVIADFTGAYSERTGVTSQPDHWNYCGNIGKNFDAWRKDGTLDPFYLNIKPLVNSRDLGFEPACYITARPVETPVTEQWLSANNFPINPVFTVKNREEKVQVAIDQKLNYFIDDNYDTFLELNKAGVCCFLFDKPHNQRYNVGYKRLYGFNDFKQRFLA